MKLTFSAVRTIVLLLTFWTGFAGLVYEVTWQRYLANLLGSQARATAIILAVFLGGLSVGYGLFGRLTRSRSAASLVKIAGWVEVGIGVWAVLFPALYAIAWERIGISNPFSGMVIVGDLAVATALIGLPTVGMGGTLPLLTQALARDLADAGPFHARVYAVNTAGAFFGCLLGGLVLIPSWGLPITMMTIGPVNLVAGFLLVAAARFLPTAVPPDETPSAVHARDSGAAGERESISLRRGSIIAFLAGFTSLSLQTILVRITGLTLGASEYAFALVVSLFILMLAVGAARLTAGRSEDFRLRSNLLLVALGCGLIYVIVPDFPYWAHVVRTLFSGAAPTFVVFHAVAFLLLGVLLAIPVGAMGRTMPLLFVAVRDRFSTLGANVGRLYGWNTAGCVAGALIGGYALLGWLNLDDVFRVTLGLVIVMVLIAPVPTATLRSRWLVLAMTAGLVAMFAVLPDWPKQRLATGTFRRKEALPYSYRGAEEFYRRFVWFNLLAYRDDPNTSVAVTENAAPAPTAVDPAGERNRSIYVNGKSDGSTAGEDLLTTRLLAHLPALLQTASSGRAAVIGFGTGITVGGLALHGDIRSVDVIEISPAVREFAPLFERYNHSAHAHPKVRWLLEDAYRVLGASQEKFAVIVSEPSNPWVTGVERLYATEFYSLVQSRLDRGGIYAQWFHTYSLSEPTLAMVIHTFSQSFPNVRIFMSGFDLIMLGSVEPIGLANLAALDRRLGEPAVRDELRATGIDRLEDLLVREAWNAPALFDGAAVHSLDFPKLAFAAGRDFYFDRSINLWEILDQRAARPWSRPASRATLLAQLKRPGAAVADEATFASLANAFCGRKPPTFFPGWAGSLYPCRVGLSGLAILGVLSAPDEGGRRHVEILRRLIGVGEDGRPRPVEHAAAASIADAEAGIELFRELASGVIEIDPGVLREYAAPCFVNTAQDSISCRRHLVEALAIVGLPERARTELEALLAVAGAQLDDGARIELRQMVELAESARAARAGSARSDTSPPSGS